MDAALQIAAITRCASELTRSLWYYQAWKALQKVDREATANFIRLAEIAMGDQMIAHACKVLGINGRTGKGEVAGFWSLYDCRRPEVDAICERLGFDLTSMRVVGAGLKYVRDKTHFHLDPIGVTDPQSVWQQANITHNQFDAALSVGNAIIGELHILIRGVPYDSWQYDGSDAMVIAQHANKHGLLYRERSSSSDWIDDMLG